MELFKAINLIYRAPVNVPYNDLDANTIDIVFSNETLEHIPPYELSQLLNESKRILKSNGVIVHLIDCSDHFSHSDNSISKINFLKYSRSHFGKYNSKFLYQNRLRASRYRDLFNDAGFKIVLWKPRIAQELKANLFEFNLDEEFIHFDSDDICTTSVIVVATHKD